MPKHTWTIAGILTGTILLIVLGASLYFSKRSEAQATATLTEAQSELAKAQAQLGESNQKLAESQARTSELQKEKEEKEFALRTHQSLEDEMRAALESKDVTISKLQGKLTVNILDRVLFDSGEADLKPDGAAVLAKVATLLCQHAELKVHVVGHTDNVPIRGGPRSKYASNWELSAARAIAAVRYLSEKGGVEPRRLGALGYGEYRPVADNATAEGRAHNRRIAIVILPDEISGAEAEAGFWAKGQKTWGVSTNTPGETVPATEPDAGTVPLRK